MSEKIVWLPLKWVQSKKLKVIFTQKLTFVLFVKTLHVFNLIWNEINFSETIVWFNYIKYIKQIMQFLKKIISALFNVT